MMFMDKLIRCRGCSVVVLEYVIPRFSRRHFMTGTSKRYIEILNNRRICSTRQLELKSSNLIRMNYFEICTRQISNCHDNQPSQDQRQSLQPLEDVIFEAVCDNNYNVSISKFKNAIVSTGLRENDSRLEKTMRKLSAIQDAHMAKQRGDTDIDKETFVECVSENIALLAKALRNHFVIPDWSVFTKHIGDMYESVKSNNSGEIATYIPQLARANPEHWAVSICTIDGQRFSIGDTNVPFCVQSMGKPFIYAQALNELGSEHVHKYVGHEPSGKSFNYISLNDENKPHNALVNSGAIVLCSLIKPESTSADRFDFIESAFKDIAGHEHVGFNNATFLSEKATANRNFALSYYMQENKCFPEGTRMMDVLDLYFQICSIEINTDSGSVMAATLANGGICPTTGQRLFSPATVRDTLTVMYSCGMYDYSGRYAFSTGVPSKSGVSGGIAMCIPNVMGICVYSPLLDQYGNSVRGVHFSEELVNKFNFHNFDNLVYTAKKLDPRKLGHTSRAKEITSLMFGAYNGDVSALMRLLLSGIDMTQVDYDSRSALHVAAAEGQLEVTKFLLEKCGVSPYSRDRWGFLPIHDARRFRHDAVAELLKKHMPEGVPVEQFHDAIVS